MRHVSKPRAAALLIQRRFAQNEAVQAERDADLAEESEIGENSTSEGFRAEIQGHNNGLPSSTSSKDPTFLSSTVEGVADEVAPGASTAADSMAAASGSAPQSVEYGNSSPDNDRDLAGPAGSTVYVGNLNFDSNEEDIAELCQEAGKIESVLLMRDARNFSRGFVSRVIRHIIDFIVIY